MKKLESGKAGKRGSVGAIRRVAPGIIKNILLVQLVLLVLLVTSASAKGIYYVTCLTGGGEGCLDTLDGASLYDGYGAIYIPVIGDAGLYVIDADSAAAESSPSIISPDTNAGDKRWLLKKTYSENITLDQLSDVATMTEAQGNIIYWNGTAWTNLAVGTSGQCLKTQGVGANPVWGNCVTSETDPTFDTQFSGKTQDDLTDGITYKRYNSAGVAITGGFMTGVQINSVQSLSTDRVVNGDFTDDIPPCDGWTVQNSGWDCSTGHAVHAGTDSYTLSQNLNVVAGELYKVIYTLHPTVETGRIAAGVTMSLGGTTGDMHVNADTYTEYIAATNTGPLIFTPGTIDIDGYHFEGYIDDVSVEKINGGVILKSNSNNDDIVIAVHGGDWHDALSYNSDHGFWNLGKISVHRELNSPYQGGGDGSGTFHQVPLYASAGHPSGDPSALLHDTAGVFICGNDNGNAGTGSLACAVIWGEEKSPLGNDSSWQYGSMIGWSHHNASGAANGANLNAAVMGRLDAYSMGAGTGAYSDGDSAAFAGECELGKKIGGVTAANHANYSMNNCASFWAKPNSVASGTLAKGGGLWVDEQVGAVYNYGVVINSNTIGLTVGSAQNSTYSWDASAGVANISTGLKTNGITSSYQLSGGGLVPKGSLPTKTWIFTAFLADSLGQANARQGTASCNASTDLFSIGGYTPNYLDTFASFVAVSNCNISASATMHPCDISGNNFKLENITAGTGATCITPRNPTVTSSVFLYGNAVSVGLDADNSGLLTISENSDYGIYAVHGFLASGANYARIADASVLDSSSGDLCTGAAGVICAYASGGVVLIENDLGTSATIFLKAESQ